MTFKLDEYMSRYYGVTPSSTYQHSFGIAQQIVKLESEISELEARKEVGILFISEQYAAYRLLPLSDPIKWRWKNCVSQLIREYKRAIGTARQTRLRLPILKAQLAMSTPSPENEPNYINANAYAKAFEQLPVSLALEGVYIKPVQPHKVWLVITIGDHVIRPASNYIEALESGRDFTDRGWNGSTIAEFAQQGIPRKPITFCIEVIFNSHDDLATNIELGVLIGHPNNMNANQAMFWEGDKFYEYADIEEGSEHINDAPHEEAVVVFHPHVRTELSDYQIYNRGRMACLGSYMTPMAKAIRDNKPTGLGLYLINYFQEFDIGDSWGKFGLTNMFRPSDLNPTVEEQKVEIVKDWRPAFVYDQGTKTLTLLNRPEVHQTYELYGSDGGEAVFIGEESTQDDKVDLSSTVSNWIWLRIVPRYGKTVTLKL